jgi:hypothetical protein
MKWSCIDEIILSWKVYCMYLHHNGMSVLPVRPCTSIDTRIPKEKFSLLMVIFVLIKNALKETLFRITQHSKFLILF